MYVLYYVHMYVRTMYVRTMYVYMCYVCTQACMHVCI